jgi:hypothetical protein
MLRVVMVATAFLGLVGCNPFGSKSTSSSAPNAASSSNAPQPGQGSKPAISADSLKAKVFSKKEFEALVLNKTKQQIIGAVGRPDDTTTDVDRPKGVISFLQEYWYFRDRVLNEDTGKPYRVARVFIKQGDEAYRIDYP